MAKSFKERDNYIIRIGEQLVPVTREVYECYYSMDRKERYQEERDQANGLVSLSSFTDKTDGLDLDVEDPKTDVEELFQRQCVRDMVKAAVESLKGNDAEILTAIYYDGLTAQEYGIKYGLKKSTVSMRHKAALKKLEKLLKKL